ncbi:phosphatase PAP2 family protein [Streptomyces sp. NPDC090025]|uniref:phosphatase PAP2 family protein n=1 Tax=Streptomyces sp. NPDC090025 TaxID=3365922 RepID=UPI003838BE09
MFWSVAVLAVVTWQVLVHGPLARLDERLSRALVDTVPRGLSESAADLGNMTVALPVLALAMLYAVRRGRRAAALWAGLAMAAVPLLIVPLKEWTARPGPLEPWATGYYPSGHTATALIAYTGAALLVSPRLLPLAALLTAVTATGLILRGFHWPLDVLASLALCVPLLRWPVYAQRYGPGRRAGTRKPSRTDRPTES